MPLDAAYAVRMVADLVPNAFTAWSLVVDLTSRLHSNGWSVAEVGRLASFIIDELRKELAGELERQSAELFAEGLDAGTIQFALRVDEHDWIAPFEWPTSLPADAAPLTRSDGALTERSLFFPVYRAEFNDEEREVAIYLDRESAVRWWHRNGTSRGSYALRGWRRGHIYPDFLLAAVRDAEARERVIVLETKGVHLAGNADTEYKRALLDRLTASFSGTAPPPAPSVSTLFDFKAALVVFDQVATTVPTILHG